MMAVIQSAPPARLGSAARVFPDLLVQEQRPHRRRQGPPRPVVVVPRGVVALSRRVASNGQASRPAPVPAPLPRFNRKRRWLLRGPLRPSGPRYGCASLGLPRSVAAAACHGAEAPSWS
jgi:hypothetical protein